MTIILNEEPGRKFGVRTMIRLDLLDDDVVLVVCDVVHTCDVVR